MGSGRDLIGLAEICRTPRPRYVSVTVSLFSSDCLALFRYGSRLRKLPTHALTHGPASKAAVRPGHIARHTRTAARANAVTSRDRTASGRLVQRLGDSDA